MVHLGDRTFDAILLVFAIPNLIPLPPGSSTVLGIPLILAAAQLAIGRSSLWLPSVVGNRTLLRRDLERLVYHGLPALRRIERLLVPRLGPLLNERLIGAACLLLAVILILPIPFGHMLPAHGIAAFSLGLLQRNGLAVLVGWAVTLASLLFVALVSSALLLMARTAVEAGRALLGVSGRLSCSKRIQVYANVHRIPIRGLCIAPFRLTFIVHCTIVGGSAETILFGDVRGGFAEAPTFGETR